MTKNLPAKPPDRSSGGKGDESAPFSSLYVENLNYSASNLTEIRRISETNPSLAEKIVETHDRMHRRENNSFIVGMVTATVVAVTLICGTVAAIIYLGWWQALALVGLLLAGSHFLRVFLTGEWSETSWFGKLVSNESNGAGNGSE